MGTWYKDPVYILDIRMVKRPNYQNKSKKRLRGLRGLVSKRTIKAEAEEDPQEEDTARGKVDQREKEEEKKGKKVAEKPAQNLDGDHAEDEPRCSLKLQLEKQAEHLLKRKPASKQINE